MSNCPVCGRKAGQEQVDTDGNLFWVRFLCQAVYERLSDDLCEWNCHTKCPEAEEKKDVNTCK